MYIIMCIRILKVMYIKKKYVHNDHKIMYIMLKIFFARLRRAQVDKSMCIPRGMVG